MSNSFRKLFTKSFYSKNGEEIKGLKGCSAPMTDEQYEQLVIPGKNDYSILVSSGNNKVSIFERLVFLVAMAPTDIVFGSDRQHISTTVIIRITFIFFYLSS